MATLNVAIKVNAAVAFNSFNTTFYTAPANGYAILNIVFAASGSALTVAGVPITPASGTTVINSLYVGPGQAVATSGGTCQGVGVSFVNTQ